MNTNQIFAVVNDITAQALGSSALAAVDTSTFVSLGNVVLSSATNTEAWINAFAQRIFATIFSERAYKNKLSDLILTESEYGAILQKIKISMPAATADPAWDLIDGQSIDMFKVHKENVSQKLFVQRSPYLLEQTFPLFQLKEAFLSPEAMGRYLAAKTLELRNKIEVISEGMGRTVLASSAALNIGTAREVNLRTLYNTAAGASLADVDACMMSAGFLRYAVRVINNYSNYLADMSTLYNSEGAERHTPKELQKLHIVSDFDEAMRTEMQYAAYNRSDVEIGTHVALGYWQNPADRFGIDIDFEGTNYSYTGVVGILADREAMGVYHNMEYVLTSPVNSTGAYYNTSYHMRRQWLIDLSENQIVFTCR